MKENNRQMAINMTAKVVAFLVNFGISFFLTPYIISTIGSETYGFVGLANNFISYAQIITVALNSMAGRFITISIHKNDYDSANKYMTSVVVANIVMSIPLTIISAVIVFNLENIFQVSKAIVTDVRLLWALLFFNFIISLIASVFGVATFARNRLDLSSRREIESNIIKAVILIGAFTLFSPSVWYLGLATLLCGIFVILTNIYYTKKLLPQVKIRKKYIDINKIKDLLLSGIWNSISKLGGVLSTGLDLLITNIFVSSTAMGTVSIAKNIPTFVLSIFSMLSSVFMPQLTISYAKNDVDDMKKQLNSAIRLLGFFSCIPVACLIAFGREFYRIWVPDQNADILQILTILVGGSLPLVLPLEPLWNIFTVTNKVKYSSLFLLSNAFVSTLGVFLLLGRTDDDFLKMCIVVGFSTLLSIIRGITFLPMYGAKCLGLKWHTFYPVIFRNIFATILTTIIAFLIKLIITVDCWFVLIISVLITTVFAFAVNFFVILGKNERKILKQKISKK